MKKIPLEILAMYLPYKVKVSFTHNRKKVIGTMDAVYSDGSIVCHDTVNSSPDKFKLLLQSLETAIKDIGISKEAFEYIWNLKNGFLFVDNVPHVVVVELLRNHVDISGLIDQGLAEEK
jgi:hypothetical protein